MDAKMNEYAIGDAKHVKILGRTGESRRPLVLFWTGSGIEMNVRGSELWVELETDYDLYEQWIIITINGFPVARQMVPKGRTWICLFRGMDAGKVKRVRMLKEMQPVEADPRSLLRVHAIRTDGSLVPVDDRPYKIEFIGDSITVGEGLAGAREEEDWVPMIFSTQGHYAILTAEALNADFRIIAMAGWGVLASWDNNPRRVIPRIYEQVCGVLAGDLDISAEALQRHDFASWQPDAVVVNLGTNDASAFRHPAWTDPESGETFKLRLADDGSYLKEDLDRFEDAVFHFLAKLRTCNPKAHLVWAYGMLGIPLMPSIRRAVDRYVRATGDRRVSVLQLSAMTEQTAGSRNHPGPLAHRKAAEELTAFLRSLLPERN